MRKKLQQLRDNLGVISRLPEIYLTKNDIYRYFNIPRSTLHYLRRYNVYRFRELVCRYIGERKILYNREELYKWIEAHTNDFEGKTLRDVILEAGGPDLGKLKKDDKPSKD